MTDERLKEIRQREQRATRAPWFAVDGDGGGEDVATILACCDTVYGPPLADFSAQWIQDDWLDGSERSLNWTEAVAADVKFCAHARTDIPELLAEVDRLKAENARLRAELGLRTMMYPSSEIPQEFRVHGQHAAYHSGFEHAWRGHPRENCYEFHTAQHRAWDRGFADGASAFAAAFAATLEAKSE